MLVYAQAWTQAEVWCNKVILLLWQISTELKWILLFLLRKVWWTMLVRREPQHGTGSRDAHALLKELTRVLSQDGEDITGCNTVPLVSPKSLSAAHHQSMSPSFGTNPKAAISSLVLTAAIGRESPSDAILLRHGTDDRKFCYAWHTILDSIVWSVLGERNILDMRTCFHILFGSNICVVSHVGQFHNGLWKTHSVTHIKLCQEMVILSNAKHFRVWIPSLIVLSVY